MRHKFMNKTHLVAIDLIIAAIALVISAKAVIAEVTDPNVSGNEVPNLLTIYQNEILSSTFIGFGVQWEYEGDKRNLNIDNPVWRSHWPAVVSFRR